MANQPKKIKLSDSDNRFKVLRLKKKDKVETDTNSSNKINVIKDILINPMYENITPEAPKMEQSMLYSMLYNSECREKEEVEIAQKANTNGAAAIQIMESSAGCQNWDSSIEGRVQGQQESSINMPFQRQMRIGEKNLDLLAQLIDGLDEPEVHPQLSLPEEGPPIDAGAPQKMVSNMITESKGLKASFTAEYNKLSLIVKELKDALQIEEARLNEVTKGLHLLQKLESNLTSLM